MSRVGEKLGAQGSEETKTCVETGHHAPSEGTVARSAARGGAGAMCTDARPSTGSHTRDREARDGNRRAKGQC